MTKSNGDSPREIPNNNQIGEYIHCTLCFREKPSGVSPREYQSIEVGWTPLGLQVWCKRHDCNILHIDFKGQTHPAITSRPEHTN